ncbi:MAG: HEAT repeat domain-containing protein [Planctomycetes bacterium]|nr:HEAT repeat domain-containing protein [Planctomycetota bacterium]
MRHTTIATASLWLAALWLSGCTGPAGYGKDIYQDFQSESPAVRIHACAAAGSSRDARTVPYLVDRLSDSEPDVRVYATIALEKIAGTRMGYEYYDPPDSRQRAIDRWRNWLAAGRPDVNSFLKQAMSQSSPASRQAGRPNHPAQSPASAPAGKPLESAPGGEIPAATRGATPDSAAADAQTAPATRQADNGNRSD